MAKAEGLWNLFLPAVSGLTQVDYALIAEETGKCFFAPDIFNCQAPGYDIILFYFIYDIILKHNFFQIF